MKIVLISDTHTYHNDLELPEGDMLIHAGDISYRGNVKELSKFNTWMWTLPYKHKIMIAGNHDFLFQTHELLAKSIMTSCTYLQDELIEIEGIKIYGSPWTPRFYDWAFMKDRGESIAEVWKKIPEGLDILVTHGPAYKIGDLCNGGNVGCEDLLRRIEEVKPKYHVFGHIHEGYGIYKIGDTTRINCSSCTGDYDPVNPPIVIEI